MKIKGKLKSQAGFSLAETMLAVLILLLVSMLMANGIPTVKAVYENVTVGANARVLLSTTVAALRNELGTAKDIKVEGDKVTYYSTDTHSTSSIYKNDVSGEAAAIMLQEYAYNLNELMNIGEASRYVNATAPRRLVTAVSATEGLYCTYESVSTTANTITFNNLCVRRKKGDKDMETPVKPIDQLTIHVAFGPVTSIP